MTGTNPNPFSGAVTVQPTTDTISVAVQTETVIGSVALPANLPAGSWWRLSVTCPFNPNGTGGPYTVKGRIGGLTGNFFGSITTSAWTASINGCLSLVCYLKLITPGGPGVGAWQGAIVHSSLAGSITNTATDGGENAVQDSTISNLMVATIALGSATFTCGPSIAIAERLR